MTMANNDSLLDGVLMMFTGDKAVLRANFHHDNPGSWMFCDDG